MKKFLTIIILGFLSINSFIKAQEKIQQASLKSQLDIIRKCAMNLRLEENNYLLNDKQIAMQIEVHPDVQPRYEVCSVIKIYELFIKIIPSIGKYLKENGNILQNEFNTMSVFASEILNTIRSLQSQLFKQRSDQEILPYLDLKTFDTLKDAEKTEIRQRFDKTVFRGLGYFDPLSPSSQQGPGKIIQDFYKKNFVEQINKLQENIEKQTFIFPTRRNGKEIMLKCTEILTLLAEGLNIHLRNIQLNLNKISGHRNRGARAA